MLKISSALLVSLLAGSAGAQTFLAATLTNASENPPTVPTTFGGQPRPASLGTASFFIDSAATFMTFTATIFNIDVNGLQTPNDVNDNLLNAHIHAGPAVTPTTNGPVVWGFFGAPLSSRRMSRRIEFVPSGPVVAVTASFSVLCRLLIASFTLA